MYINMVKHINYITYTHLISKSTWNLLLNNNMYTYINSVTIYNMIQTKQRNNQQSHKNVQEQDRKRSRPNLN